MSCWCIDHTAKTNTHKVCDWRGNHTTAGGVCWCADAVTMQQTATCNNKPNHTSQLHLQSHSWWPHIHLESWEGIKAIGNLWRLECWWSLAGATSVVHSKCVQGLMKTSEHVKLLLYHSTRNSGLMKTSEYVKLLLYISQYNKKLYSYNEKQQHSIAVSVT